MRDLDQARPTGLFFDAQTPGAIAAAVGRFEREGSRILPENCRANALDFTPSASAPPICEQVTEAWTRHGGHVVRQPDAA